MQLVSRLLLGEFAREVARWFRVGPSTPIPNQLRVEAGSRTLQQQPVSFVKRHESRFHPVPQYLSTEQVLAQAILERLFFAAATRDAAYHQNGSEIQTPSAPVTLHTRTQSGQLASVKAK